MGSVIVIPKIGPTEPDQAGDQRRSAIAGLVLAALAGATYQQGGFYSAAQWYLAALLVAATAIALTLVGRRPAGLLSGWRTVVAPLTLVAWTLLDAGRHGSIGSGIRLAALALAVIVVIASCRALHRSAMDLLLGGLLVLGAITGLVGWYGVASHHDVLAIPGQGLWRAAGTLSYPNAAATLLALTALIGIALRCSDRSPDRFRIDGALLTAVLTGLAATLSRGGLLAFAAGLLVLLVLLRANLIWKACWPPLAGTLVALAGLLPAMPVSSRPQLAPAVLTLAIGLAIGSVRPVPRLLRAIRSGPGSRVFLGLFGAGAIVLLAVLEHRASAAIGHARANLSSADRLAAWHAVWHQIALHPVAGAGPGLRQLSWRAPDGSLRIFAYAHDEYLQLFAELGLIGIGCLLGCAISLVRLLLRSRSTGYRWPLGIAAVLSTAVSVAFDFTGHFPAITLTAAALVGCATGPGEPAQAPHRAVPTTISSMKGEMA